LKLNLKRLKESPGQSFQVEWSEQREKLDHKGRMLPFKRDVTLKGRVFYRSGIVYLRAQLSTEVEVECSRCLAPLAAPVQLEVSLELHEEPESGLKGAPLEGFHYPQGAEELELLPYLERLISSSLESKPLCRPDCQGLCPSCGHDLNVGPCGCVESRPGDPRLEVLKKLLD